MNMQPSNKKIPTILLPGRQGWDTAIPFPFRAMNHGGTLCVIGASIMGDVVAVQAEHGATVELYPCDLIEGLSDPIPHINC